MNVGWTNKEENWVLNPRHSATHTIVFVVCDAVIGVSYRKCRQNCSCEACG